MSRIVGITLVGQSHGRREIRWGTAFLLSCALGLFGATVAAATYLALSGEFSTASTIIGFAGPFIIVGNSIQVATKLPIEQLAPLSDSPH